MISLVLLILPFLVLVKADIFSVIVAGSSGYSNYRHQADVCHAYNILRDNGVPANNIIVMAFDDIAYNVNNPFPGTLFNIGSGAKPGFNYYKNCPIDYQGMSVNIKNYQAILKGEKENVKGGTGRVLQSGPDDEVFLFYSDHGNTGYIKFPDPAGYIYQDGETNFYADQMIELLTDMHKLNKYSTLTYYLNACHSGSMWENLPRDINVYTLSAANSTQSGWGCFCPPLGSMVNGISIDSCLSSQFPASWMQNTEYFNTNSETLGMQFQFSKLAVTGSQVQSWGDGEFQQWPVSKFLGGLNQQDKPINVGFKARLEKLFGAAKEENAELKAGMEVHIEEQRMIEMNYYLRQYKKNPSEENYKILQKDLETSQKFKQVFDKFNSEFNLDGSYPGSTDYNCYRKIMADLNRQCGKFNDFSLQYSKYLYQYCSAYKYTQVQDFGCVSEQEQVIEI